MPKKIDFFDLMTDHVDKDTSDCWFDDKQFESIPHKLLLPPYSVNLSLVYPKDEKDELDDLPLEENDVPEDELTKRLPIRKVTVNFVHEFIVDSIMNSNMDDDVKFKTIQMLGTSEAHIVKSDSLSDDASRAWDEWAYNLEKLNSHTNGYTVLTNFEGHIYPSRDPFDDSGVEFRIINLPDTNFLPFNH